MFDNHVLVFKIMGIMSNEDDRRMMIYMYFESGEIVGESMKEIKVA